MTPQEFGTELCKIIGVNPLDTLSISIEVTPMDHNVIVATETIIREEGLEKVLTLFRMADMQKVEE